MTDDKKKATKYACPNCDQSVVVYVNLSEPPMHRCGGSSRKEKWLPLEVTE